MLVQAAVLALAVAPAAQAATVGAGASRLTFEAAGGEANRATFGWEGASVRIDDPGAGIVLGLGCLPDGLTLTTARCPSPAGGPLGGLTGCDVCGLAVALGDRDDVADLRGTPPFLFATVNGGAGADRLSADGERATLMGDSGDDTLTGRAADGGPGDDRILGTNGDDGPLIGGPGADTITGDGGEDTASYEDRAGPVRVTLDAIADDGADGERDDVRTENVTGGKGDDVLIGGGAANRLNAGAGENELRGAGGRDRLLGGPDRDTLDGGPGDDTILSSVGARRATDDVICGAGDDEAQVTRADRVADDCEHVYYGGTPVPRLTIAGPARVRARGGVLRLSVSAQPAESGFHPAPGSELPPGPQIRATATLRALRGRPRGVLGRATLAPFAAPATAPLALRLTARARRELAARGTIRMRVAIAARDAEGNESLTRRLLVVRR